MKKLMVIVCVLSLLWCCCCMKMPQNSSSDAQSTAVSYEETPDTLDTSSSSVDDEPMVDEAEPLDDVTGSEEEPTESEADEEPIVSTITAPISATLYRGGKAIPMTDAALNLKIAQEIESWFAGADTLLGTKCLITPEIIEEIKATETCIEFIYNDLILINGESNTFRESVRFILTLEKDKTNRIILGDAEKYKSGGLGVLNSNVEKVRTLIEHLQ